MLFRTTSVDKKIHEAQARMQKHAQALAKHNDAILDYSEESLKEVDRILEIVATEVDSAGMKTELEILKNEGVMGIAESLGSYIAECAEKQCGRGKWAYIDPDSAEPRLGLVISTGATIFPMDWVLRKILSPKTYSIYAAYTQFVL